ncbi:hypothetical protein T4B_3880 [Trichinella pseudospiralis]|uniref:Uncharacterized protein n=2 Tax=Trichinella pseudospiralis TaxID=6337 RepID=A0A0V1FTQ2_TRIPS|nr:hypothetical protein T4E_11086 [Trichinella pseudospiralis]KRY89374.1 hypothetical protein T4D_15060 [Trichinella pseudospiralis]KRZ23661.1 hypothetical protein T4B_3880 [Trichinella pseudospiralis]KRZ35703.1 hypothetical protein T4C_14179 [Trichinella pseudospiralis]
MKLLCPHGLSLRLHAASTLIEQQHLMRVCNNVSDDRRQPKSDRHQQSFDDDHSPTVVNGKSYASFADRLPVDDSQKLGPFPLERLSCEEFGCGLIASR